MKQTFFSTIAFLVMTAAASAQTTSRVDFSKTVAAFNTSATETGSPATEAPAVNAKVARAFSKSFAGVTPTWHTAPNDQYLARFSSGGAVTHALYKKGGLMVYSVTRGSASILPAEVTSVLKHTYPDYKISAATKAVSSGVTAWFADLRMGTNLVVVKVIDGEIVEATHYQTDCK